MYRWFLVLAASCGVEERPPPNRFVGTSEGSKTLVFVVADPGITSAYACDGTTQPAVFEWFTGDEGRQLTLTSETGAATLSFDLDAETASLGSKDFVLAPVDDRFGLYRGTKVAGEDTYEAGIILADEEIQNGVIGITTAGSDELTTVVSPRIETNQVAVTLLNEVRIPLAVAREAYTR